MSREAAVPGTEIHLRIERLTFEGLAAGDARRVGNAFERRLAALLLERGMPAAIEGAAVEGLALGRLELDLGRWPERSGQELAERLYARLAAPLADGPEGEKR